MHHLQNLTSLVLQKIYAKNQAFTERWLSYAKAACYGKVIGAQKFFAECHAHRLTVNSDNEMCKNAESHVKTFTDHCEFAFPFELPIDSEISSRLDAVVNLEGISHGNGAITVSTGQNAYSGYIAAQAATTAEDILNKFEERQIPMITDGEDNSNTLANNNFAQITDDNTHDEI